MKVAFVAFTALAFAQECPQDFDIVHEGECFKVVEEAKTFWDAKTFCEDLNGKLIVPKADEDDWVALNEALGAPRPFWAGVMRRRDCRRWVFAQVDAVGYREVECSNEEAIPEHVSFIRLPD